MAPQLLLLVEHLTEVPADCMIDFWSVAVVGGVLIFGSAMATGILHV